MSVRPAIISICPTLGGVGVWSILDWLGPSTVLMLCWGLLLLLVLSTVMVQISTSEGRVGATKIAVASSTVATPSTTRVVKLGIPVLLCLSVLERGRLLKLLVILLRRYKLRWLWQRKLLLWYLPKCWLSGSILSWWSSSVYVVQHVCKLVDLGLNGLHVCSHIGAHLLVRLRQCRKSFGVGSKCGTKILNRFFVC